MLRLPAEVQEKILTLPEYHMGAHRVDLVLRDGRVISDVIVAWGDEVIRIAGHDVADDLPFAPEDVLDVLPHNEG